MRTVDEAGGGGEGGEALCGAVAPRYAREVRREGGVREQCAEPAHLHAGRAMGCGWRWGRVGVELGSNWGLGPESGVGVAGRLALGLGREGR